MNAYGATRDQAEEKWYYQDPYPMERTRQSYFPKGKRKSLNILGIVVSLIAPWVLFCGCFALMSFGMRYTRPVLAYSLDAIFFFVGVFYPMSLAIRGCQRKAADPFGYQPTWYFFLAVTCLIAFIAGDVAGNMNYDNYMQPYYSLTHLAHYKGVDTNDHLGQQYMDAGMITFKNSTALDLSHSMGFKSHDVFCVAPIVTKSSLHGKPLTSVDSVDFWAIGKNCCSGVQADFHCKGFADPSATGAIRLMGHLEADRALYRLAVQQAEATYKITAMHPLFFEWVHDPDDAMWHFAQTAYTNYLCGVVSYFLVQIFLTTIAMLAFSKMVHGG